MHTQKTADNLQMHATVLTDPTLERASNAYDKLIDVMGEEKAERWFDANIREWESWISMYDKLAAKLTELHNASDETEAEHRHDINCIRYAGAG